MPAAEQLTVTVEVDEVNQQLLAGRAHETRRVPESLTSTPRCKHRDLASRYQHLALKTYRKMLSTDFPI